LGAFGLEALAGEDAIPAAAGRGNIGGAEVHTEPLGGAVWQVDRAVEPPGAVVAPEVVVGTADFLPAGKFNKGGVHGEVGSGIATSRDPENENARANDIGSGVGILR
jgi:hypothetical protein